MVRFVNVVSVDRIIDAVFNGLNEKVSWKNRTLRLFTQAARHHRWGIGLTAEA